MSTEERVLSRQEMFEVIDHAFNAASPEGTTDIVVSGYWQGSTRWSRNRIGMSSNRTDYNVFLGRNIDGGWGVVQLNQVDEQSIASAVKFAEWRATLERTDQKPHEALLGVPEYSDPDAYIWGDATAHYDSIDSGKIVQLTCKRAEELDLMAAGYIECTSGTAAYAEFDSSTREYKKNYVRMTRGKYSVTARNPKGMGSGWSGITEIDFAKVDEQAIAEKAFEKCMASMNPVQIEPGRYTTILEPQAVADLVGPYLFANNRVMDRAAAESKPDHTVHPFYLSYDSAAGLHRSKLGLRVFDERINVWHDPMDPDLGLVGFVPKEAGVKKISYVENGVLVSLPYDKLYSANRLEANDQNVHRMSFRMSGGNTTIEEMIESTSRGLLVTRFSGGSITDASSLIATGITRDGLWLIENGKIKHAVRNFKTLESPFFVLNNVEQIGIPQKVYAREPSTILDGMRGINVLLSFATKNFAPQYIVPPLKVNDFSFVATVDAV